jgi:hypothetical protein
MLKQMLMTIHTGTFKTEDNLLGSLGLLVENGLGLTTITGLLTVITSLTLSEERSFTSLVLSNLVRSVLLTLGTLAVGVTGLGNVDLIILLISLFLII